MKSKGVLFKTNEKEGKHLHKTWIFVNLREYKNHRQMDRREKGITVFRRHGLCLANSVRLCMQRPKQFSRSSIGCGLRQKL